MRIEKLFFRAIKSLFSENQQSQLNLTREYHAFKSKKNVIKLAFLTLN